MLETLLCLCIWLGKWCRDRPPETLKIHWGGETYPQKYSCCHLKCFHHVSCLALQQHNSDTLTTLPPRRYLFVLPTKTWRWRCFQKPQALQKGAMLGRMRDFNLQQGLLQQPRSHVYSTALLVRKKRWWLWRGLNSKSLPVLRGNYYSFVPAEGAPCQTS